jgi:hypothetical protein
MRYRNQLPGLLVNNLAKDKYWQTVRKLGKSVPQKPLRHTCARGVQPRRDLRRELRVRGRPFRGRRAVFGRDAWATCLREPTRVTRVGSDWGFRCGVVPVFVSRVIRRD